MRFFLASNSPRRRELLKRLVPAFETEPSRFAEEGRAESARATAVAFACGKAEDVFSRHADSAVLGADTVVSLGGEIFGKPRSADEARAMLHRLSGRTHTVYTGLCLLAPHFRRTAAEETRVTFRTLSDALIEAYIATGSPMDKAGAYGIQDDFPLVERCEGSMSNVVGLPLELLQTMLREAGMP